MTSPLVVITDSDLPGDGGEALLRSAGFRVRRAQARTSDDVVHAARGAAGLIVQWAPITETVFSKLRDLRFVSRLGIGYDMIDVEAATRHGVVIANTPAYCVAEVATHTVAMILSFARGLGRYDAVVRAGEWGPAEVTAVRPQATCVAVIGYGRIGSRVATAAAALGFTVVVHDTAVPAATITSDGFEPVDLTEALTRADFLSLHVPLTATTRHLLGHAALADMKPNAVVINTCRGGLIDERALVDAIENGEIAGAGLDVYEQEPLAPDSRLRELQNVILTPHVAWFSEQALRDLPIDAARNMIGLFAGDTDVPIVNSDVLAVTPRVGHAIS